MNDKSKKKSIIMVLAVFIAIAAFASPLFMGDDNGDSNTVILSEGASDNYYTEVSSQDDINDATEDNLVLAKDIEGDLTIPTGKALYGIDVPSNQDNLIGAPDGAKTIKGNVTLEAGATLNFINVDGKVSICDNEVNVDKTTSTAVNYCTIIAGTNIAISYLDIQTGSVSIFSNSISNKDTTNAILSFEGARDDLRGVTATPDTFNLNIQNNKLTADKGRAFSGNDKVGEGYKGGSEISISSNTINDAPSWGASITFRALNEKSSFTVERNDISNGDKPELGLAGYSNNSFSDSNSYLAGLITDAKSLIIPANSVAVLSEKSELKFEKITIIGTITYDGSSISAVDGISTIKAGSLIINGELAPIEEGKSIIVSGDAIIGGSLAGTLVILPAELGDDGNVLTKSNIIFYNLETVAGANIEYKKSVDSDAVKSNDIANELDVSTNEAGEYIVNSYSYIDRGVTVDVHDIYYSSTHQDAPVTLTQYYTPTNNIKALTEIEYYAPGGLPGSSVPITYNIADYAHGIKNENGISAKIEKLTGNVVGFGDLKITNAGTYVLIYSVSTSENIGGQYVVDDDFDVTFKVHQKIIAEIGEKVPIKIYDTNKDVHSSITSNDIIEGDDVLLIAHYLSENIGLWPVIIDEINGEDAINYTLSNKYDVSKYNTVCGDGCNCIICNNSLYEDLPNDDVSQVYNCACENCICDYVLQGLILPKIITEDMIDVNKTHLSLDNKRIYPVITITLLEQDGNGDSVKIELDTSKMDPVAPFNGYFIYEDEGRFNKCNFGDGIDAEYSLNWIALISELNPKTPELSNYIASSYIGGAFVSYNKLATADEISDVLNQFHTLDWNNEPLTDIIGNTMFMSYYLADGLGEDITYVLKSDFSGETLYCESVTGGINEGMRAWYFSFDDQAKGVELKAISSYTINISAGKDIIGSFSFDTDKNASVGKLVLNSLPSTSDSIPTPIMPPNDPAAWASTKAFEVSPGYTIYYHYMYNSTELSGEGQHQHIEQIINPMFLNLGMQYTFSNVGISPGNMAFVQWTTLDTKEMYGNCAINPRDGQFSHSVNPMQVIDKEFLNKYVDKDTGILNLYADYYVFEPVNPDGDKSIEGVSAGFNHYADDAKTHMSLWGIKANDVINNTAWLIYDQNGYENSEMQGILYKLVDGELTNVFTENLLDNDGRRAWYFSFDDQAKSVVDEYGLEGYYVAHIVADDKIVLEYSFKISEMSYAVKINADYAVASGSDAIKVYLEPMTNSIVPAGELTIIYNLEHETGLTATLQSFVGSISESPSMQSTTVPLNADGGNLVSAHAIYKWTDNNGVVSYSVSNIVTPIGE